MNNLKLREKFDAIDSKLQNLAALRNFRDYLSDNKKIIPELGNLDLFKNNLWISYLQEHKDLYKEALNAYRKGKVELGEILDKASVESIAWRNVIAIYNNRFKVPFKVKIRNQADATLKENTSPHVWFEFQDDSGNEPQLMEKDEIFHILSAGERKALYILNIIFEVEARNTSGEKTFFIIDDIADSFDYKNKYAILQYLKDISEEHWAHLIILTHNFDFYRSINSRLDMPREHMLQVIKKPKRHIQICQQKYRYHPFNHWRRQLRGTPSDEIIIVSIPFARNIAEYSGNGSEYNNLAQYLHFREDTEKLTIGDLTSTLNNIFLDLSRPLPGGERNVLKLIYDTAKNICSAGEDDSLDLEKKIILSVAIRIKAEEFILNALNKGKPIKETEDSYLVTQNLIELFKEKNSDDPNLGTLDSVGLMTPSNIHINSFMFEPIVDTSIHYLISLYQDVCKMKKPQ